MAVVNSSTFNFKEIVDDFMRSYKNEVVEAGYKVIPKVAKEAASKLRSESRAQFGRGKYASGWKSKSERGRLNVVAKVYGESGTYQLAHLLEYGHVTRNGTGRTWDTKDKTAHPHIAAVEEWAMDKAYNDMMDELRTIG